jgi:hypothetical protein
MLLTIGGWDQVVAAATQVNADSAKFNNIRSFTFACSEKLMGSNLDDPMMPPGPAEGREQ